MKNANFYYQKYKRFIAGVTKEEAIRIIKEIQKDAFTPPKKEDYGYTDGDIENESGWTLEGGEDEYYKALVEWSKNIRENMNKLV